MKNLFSALLIGVIATSCSSTPDFSHHSTREYQVGAYTWFQHSAEYKALTYQAYNVAERMVKEDLKIKRSKKRAVVFDIDETVLDNSYAGAYEIKNNIKWDEKKFEQWVLLKKATAIPGARDFVDFLVKNNIEPIFISNRRIGWTEETYQNLASEGFKVKRENVILMDQVKSKEDRRNQVAKKYDIIMLVGDNLLDFNQLFDKASHEMRGTIVDQMRKEFGTRYIVLPNPMYGDWEYTLPKDVDKKDLLKVRQ